MTPDGAKLQYYLPDATKASCAFLGERKIFMEGGAMLLNAPRHYGADSDGLFDQQYTLTNK
ncbi:hypothetical protein T11_56 [Trichinella zimbabwensis]|uniref:Uncharacterized protein n=1 Tax=Trichinella zimbabwensis TaxID=268475 RepID=A0A0V1I374_9BILA|nr:hypothetical protein T11_56 [Trichinella zimbabwensis]